MYSIGQTAKLTGLSIDTLRYYEKIGLTKPPVRAKGRLRSYSEEDVRFLISLQCLKKTGLTLVEMKAFLMEGQCYANPYFPLSAEDRETIESRTSILAEHLARMEAQYAALASLMEQTKEKLEVYRELLAKEATKP
ncbi:MerR family transcriptional regulator [Cohnella thailandensis]|uniref:MerR family transcriptional regulator n=1 Tax=Cohnella thailandensis TaxID=557557 RepID=A0A841T1N1_9BACL|nr:MerR family transcriptional regulator [Cohnella thailandensis]MBB6637462.1 MerR family transcriptional regulator [Cohnella thailandensis]MBP1977493.1 DNA-binding transcriptional MerR regulator [Cohnella thailandensis]